VRFIAADTHPDHDTIAAFRRENAVAFAAAFADVLSMAQQLTLLSVGMVSIDGAKIEANASKIKWVRYDRAKALRAQLDADIAAMMARAEAADREQTADPQALPDGLARRQALRSKLDAACARLEAEAKARAEAERRPRLRSEATRPRSAQPPWTRPQTARRHAAAGGANQSDRPGQHVDAQVQTPRIPPIL
jgi:hypothetical protein